MITIADGAADLSDPVAAALSRIGTSEIPIAAELRNCPADVLRDNPLHKLRFGVLLSALSDYKKPQQRPEVLSWLCDDACRAPFDFAAICACFGWDEAALRVRILRWAILVDCNQAPRRNRSPSGRGRRESPRPARGR